VIRVEWVPLHHLLDSSWCKTRFHIFAAEQARSVLPVVRQLLGGCDDLVSRVSEQLAAVTVSASSKFKSNENDEGLNDARVLPSNKDVNPLLEMEQQRRAPDGHYYTQQEFADYFGGLDEWRLAPPRRQPGSAKARMRQRNPK
jgi:hypothetical protein